MKLRGWSNTNRSSVNSISFATVDGLLSFATSEMSVITLEANYVHAIHGGVGWYKILVSVQERHSTASKDPISNRPKNNHPFTRSHYHRSPSIVLSSRPKRNAVPSHHPDPSPNTPPGLRSHPTSAPGLRVRRLHSVSADGQRGLHRLGNLHVVLGQQAVEGAGAGDSAEECQVWSWGEKGGGFCDEFGVGWYGGLSACEVISDGLKG